MISGAAFRGGPFSYLMHPMLIRPETPDDIDAIRDLTAAAFASMPYSDGTEPEMIDRLRAAAHGRNPVCAGPDLIRHGNFSLLRSVSYHMPPQPTDLPCAFLPFCP